MFLPPIGLHLISFKNSEVNREPRGMMIDEGKTGSEEERLRQDKPWKRGNTGIYIDYRRIYV